jgi:hypothetical protein
MDLSRTKIIACATVVEEMLPLLPPGAQTQTLEPGLHVRPEALHSALQAAIDETVGTIDTIVIGYGLCSQAVIGLHSTACTLVVPRVDDCIALCLGSCLAYRQQTRQEPGTFYLTRGWIEAGLGLSAEYQQLLERYGARRAERIMQLTLQHYTRLAFVDTGQPDLDPYRQVARQTSEQFGLRYEEIPGSLALLKKTIQGPWDTDFVVVPPGQAIRYEDFAGLMFLV